MFRKRLTSILLASALVFAQTSPVMADTRDQIASARAEKSEAESDLAAASNLIDTMQSEQNELQSYLDDLNTQLTDLSASLEDLNSQITVKKTEIEITKASVERAKLEEQSQYEDMKTRIKYMYENGNADVFVSLLETKDITEFLTRAHNISEMTSYDRERLEDYKKAKEVVIKQETELEEEQQSLESLKAEQEATKAEVQNLADTTGAQIAEYTSKISEEEMQR